MKQEEALGDEEQQLQDPLAGDGDISSPYASLDYLIEMQFPQVPAISDRVPTDRQFLEAFSSEGICLFSLLMFLHPFHFPALTLTLPVP